MTETVAAVVVAAGRGERAGAKIPKQYRSIGGEPMIRTTLRAFVGHPHVDFVQPVINPNDRGTYDHAVAGLNNLLPPAAGGATRQASVLAGLEVLASHNPGLVLIHDAARPFVSAALIDRAIGAGRNYGAAVPGIALTDTVKSIDDSATVTGTLDRSTLRIVQTPQAFAFNLILEAHRRAAAAQQESFTDDAALAEWACQRVRVFAGEAAKFSVECVPGRGKSEFVPFRASEHRKEPLLLSGQVSFCADENVCSSSGRGRIALRVSYVAHQLDFT